MNRDQQIKAQASTGDKTYAELGRLFSITRERVRQIVTRPLAKKRGRPRIRRPPEPLLRLQYTRHPIREIARIWHVSVPTVSNWMNDYNISRADYPHYGKGRRGPAQFKSNRLPVPERPHLLRYAAIESVAELAVRYGVSKSLVYRWLAQDEIDHKALRASSNRGMYYEKKKPRKRRKKTKKARG